MIAHRAPGFLRTSSVSVRQCFGWCCPKGSNTPPAAPAQTANPTTPPAGPSPPAPVVVQAVSDPNMLPGPVAPTMVATQAATASRPAAAAAAAAAPIATSSKALPPSSRSFFDIMKFNGAAPELVNGRLAMIGIVAAATKEVQTSQTVLQQVQTAPLWWWGVLLLWVWASLVPISKGARHEAFGAFSPKAEITNGRAAMLGFAILLALEYKAGVPFF